MLLGDEETETRKYHQLFKEYLQAYDYLTLGYSTLITGTKIVGAGMVSAVLLEDSRFGEELTEHLNQHKDDWFGCTTLYMTCKHFSDDIIEVQLGRKVVITLLGVTVHGE